MHEGGTRRSGAGSAIRGVRLRQSSLARHRYQLATLR